MEWVKESELWWFLSDKNNRDILYLIGGAVAAVAVSCWKIYVHFSTKKRSRSTQAITRNYDWNIRDALEWWEKVTGLNRGDEKVLGFFSDLRQSACDGNITVWGRSNSEHRHPSQYTEPLLPIPAEHWTHIKNVFDTMRYINAKNEDMIRDAATPPGTDSIPVGTRYVDLRLSSTEVKKIARKMRMFDRLWKFLSEEKNLEILSFMGTGIAALFGAAWTVNVYFLDNNSSFSQNVVAHDSGMAAGRDINIGITLEQHEASLKRKEEEIRKEYAASAPGSVQRSLREKELAALGKKLTHLQESLQTTQKLYADTVQLLEEKLSAQLPPDRIEQAKTAITDGDPALAESLLEKVVASRMQQSAEASHLLGLLAKDRVDYEKAWQALVRTTKLMPDNPLFLNDAGLMACTLGYYDKAIKFLEKALDLVMRAHGPEYPPVATIWNNLGCAWDAKGKYDKAIGYYKKALASDLINFGPEHPDVALRWNNLGLAWYNKGEFGKAIEYFEKALASDLKNLGPEHPQLAIHWNNLGSAWQDKGKTDKSIEYFEKALAIDLKTFGPEHPNVAVRWNNLGGAWAKKANYDKAIEYFKKALTSNIKIFGPEHPNVATGWNNLGSAWQGKEEYDTALEYHEKALSSNLKSFDPDHPRVAKDWNNLGSAWQGKGDTDKAIEFYERALASDLKTFGPGHPKVATGWNNLGEIWRQKGKYGKAIEYHEKALASDLINFGPEHPDVAVRWNILGATYYAKGQYDKAIEYFDKAIASDIKTFGPEDIRIAINWKNLGEAWRAKGNPTKARKSYKKALVAFKKSGLEPGVKMMEENIRSLPPEK
ncbi:MAG: tetratricopeptide repeat protein [Nitrospinota bacterium]|nr:tetratricopeptide repeat protein [Nitrospinota bacterium]